MYDNPETVDLVVHTLCLSSGDHSINISSAFCITLQQICLNIATDCRHDIPDGLEFPHQFLLKNLFGRLPLGTDESTITHTNYTNLFNLICNLIEIEYSTTKVGTSDTKRMIGSYPVEDLLNTLMRSVVSRPIIEPNNATESQVDSVLVGILRIITVILHNEPSYCSIVASFSEESDSNLSVDLFNKFLFALPNEEDVQNNIPSLPKCKTNSSRQAAFGLLKELCVHDSNSAEIITQYIAKLLVRFVLFVLI